MSLALSRTSACAPSLLKSWGSIRQALTLPVSRSATYRASLAALSGEYGIGAKPGIDASNSTATLGAIAAGRLQG